MLMTVKLIHIKWLSMTGEEWQTELTSLTDTLVTCDLKYHSETGGNSTRKVFMTIMA